MLNFVRNHKIITGIAVVLLLLVLFVGYRMKGPYRSYRVDYVITGSGEAPGVLEVGVAKRDITPDMDTRDSWVDTDNDGRFRDDRGDGWKDDNGNGRMDLVWLGGFSNNRPAKGVHDPLWVRAIAFRNNGVTLAMVTIDSVGIMHEKFIKVRKSLDPALGIDHVLFSTTHDHESPDTMGIWSYSPVRPKFDHAYMDGILQACKEAVEEAVANLEPADMGLLALEIDPSKFVHDSRKPIVFDKTICCARFTKHGTDETIATMLGWGNHPETLGSGNSLISSDFPHYWRKGVETGVLSPNGVEGLGGMCLYFQGMVGGLMTPLHLKVTHRDGTVLEGDNYPKTEALGDNLAIATVNGLRGEDVWQSADPGIAVAAKTIFIPIDGLFSWAMMFGLIHPGYYWGKGKTEVNAIRIGELEILTAPGELYPEVAEGGMESPAGADYPDAPILSPPLRAHMNGRVNMVIGLANDEIGYMVPKSQWDTEPPYAYSDPDNPRKKPQYGEENSCGPDVVPVYHCEAVALLDRLHAAL